MLRMRDSGIGLETSELTTMFELFRQAESSRVHDQGGLGIGLALCRRLIAMHAGAIWAESAGLGRGSLFSVRLPLDEQSLSNVPASEWPRERTSADAGFRHRKLA